MPVVLEEREWEIQSSSASRLFSSFLSYCWCLSRLWVLSMRWAWAAKGGLRCRWRKCRVAGTSSPREHHACPCPAISPNPTTNTHTPVPCTDIYFITTTTTYRRATSGRAADDRARARQELGGSNPSPSLPPLPLTMSAGSKLGKIVLGAAEVTGLKEASRRIFGNLPHLNIGKTGNKILRKPLIADKVATYYPATIDKIAHKEWYGYKTDLDIWRENRLSRMYMRGNPPTKKGEGKRAQQAKKKK